MSHKAKQVPRRQFLKSALSVGGVMMAPQIIPSSALGLDGFTAQ